MKEKEESQVLSQATGDGCKRCACQGMSAGGERAQREGGDSTGSAMKCSREGESGRGCAPLAEGTLITESIRETRKNHGSQTEVLISPKKVLTIRTY